MHVERCADAVTLDWARRGFHCHQGRGGLAVDGIGWRRLQVALLDAKFFGLDATDQQMGLDGANWMFEGRRRDVYRVVRRWCPQDE